MSDEKEKPTAEVIQGPWPKTKRKGKIIYRAYASHRYHEDRMKQKRYEKQQQIVGTLETCMS